MKRTIVAATIILFSAQLRAQAPANDECSGATTITALPYHLTQNTRLATPNPADPILLCADSGRGKTVWYSYAADTTRYVTFSSLGSTNGTLVYDVAMGLFTGSCGSLTQVACNDDIDAGSIRAAEITFLVQAGTTYILHVAEWHGGGANGGVPTGGDLNLNVFVSKLDTVKGPKSGNVAGGVTVSTNTFAEAPLGKRREQREIENEEDFTLLPAPKNVTPPTGPRGSNLFLDRRPAAVQTATSQPVVIKNFQGIPDQGVTIPPDPIMAVGPNHIIMCVNTRFRIADKNGTILKTIESDSWFATALTNASPFDPQVIYDQFDHRWVMVWDNLTATTAHILVSVSDDDNPLGTWYNWALPATKLGDSTVDEWSDYPGLGYDSLALYIASNDFALVGSGTSFARVRIVPKAQLYANTAGPVAYKDFWDFRDPNNISVKINTIRASMTFGYPGREFFLNGAPYDPGTFVTLWKLFDPLGSPNFTAKNVPVVEYAPAPSAGQLGGGALPIETGIGLNRLQFQPVYRDSSLFCARPVGMNTSFSAISYLRLDPFADTAKEDYALGLNGYWYFYPALMVDQDKNVIITYCRSSSSDYVSTFTSGRRSTDPPGLSPSIPIKPGVANYVKDFGSGRNRWGDYSGVGLDPADLNAVWTLNEYPAGPNIWGTWVGKLKMAPVPGKYAFGSPLNIDFGIHEQGTSSDTQSVSVTNFGSDSLTVTGLGTPDSNFVLVSAPTFPTKLATYQSIQLKYAFTPKLAGVVTDTVGIMSDDTTNGTLPLVITGKGFFITLAQGGTLYAGTGSPTPTGNLLSLNHTNGAPTTIGPAGYDQLNRIRVRPSNHEIVGLAQVGANMTIVRVNSLAGDAHPVASIPLSVVKTLALRADTVYVGRISGGIYRVDYPTGTPTLVANSGLVISGMDFNPLTGELWVAGRPIAGGNPDRIYKVALPSGTATLVGSTGFNTATTELLFDGQGHLFGLITPSGNPTSLVLIDTATAIGTIVGSTGITGVLTLALDPASSFYTHTYRLDSSWNLASIPMTLPTYDKSTLFRNAASKAFFWEGSYVSHDTLAPGLGFWMKFNGSAVDNLTGSPIMNDTIPVKQRWNMVGSLGVPIPVGSISSSPGGIISSNFFYYNGGYFIGDSIRPGKGYWVRTSSDGQLFLSSSSAVPKTSVVQDIALLARLNSITIANSQGYAQKLYFGRESDVQIDLSRFDMPPLPPPGIFDARFSSNRLLEIFAGKGSRDYPIEIRSSSPVSLSWHVSSYGVKYSLVAKNAESRVLNGDGIWSPQISDLRLHAESAQIPSSFALRQNYPNPFNPSTTIRYELPDAAPVTLVVYDILGKEIARLAEGKQDAGFYEVPFSSRDLSSGVYFYRLTAGNFSAVRKMLILK